jgi:hypothetical protein
MNSSNYRNQQLHQPPRYHATSNSLVSHGTPSHPQYGQNPRLPLPPNYHREIPPASPTSRPPRQRQRRQKKQPMKQNLQQLTQPQQYHQPLHTPMGQPKQNHIMSPEMRRRIPNSSQPPSQPLIHPHPAHQKYPVSPVHLKKSIPKLPKTTTVLVSPEKMNPVNNAKNNLAAMADMADSGIIDKSHLEDRQKTSPRRRVSSSPRRRSKSRRRNSQSARRRGRSRRESHSGSFDKRQSTHSRSRSRHRSRSRRSSRRDDDTFDSRIDDDYDDYDRDLEYDDSWDKRNDKLGPLECIEVGLDNRPCFTSAGNACGLYTQPSDQSDDDRSTYKSRSRGRKRRKHSTTTCDCCTGSVVLPPWVLAIGGVIAIIIAF